MRIVGAAFQPRTAFIAATERYCKNRRRPRPRNRKKHNGVEDEDENEDEDETKGELNPLPATLVRN
jgi:hypothetical protein